MKCPECNVEEIHSCSTDDGTCPKCKRDVTFLLPTRKPKSNHLKRLAYVIVLIVSVCAALTFAYLWRVACSERDTWKEILDDHVNDYLREYERRI